MTAAGLRPVGLTLRLHRWEAVGLALVAIAGVALTLLVAARLDAVGFGAQCVTSMREAAATPPDCELKANEFYGIVSGEAGIASAILTFVPYLAALLIGVAVVGRELERGTTRLAWALTPSRLRWLAQRLVPVALLVFAIALVLGAAADRLLAATEPGVDPANAMLQLGSRGPLLAVRALWVMSIAVLAGALVGRALPALLVATVVAAVGLTGGSTVHGRIIASEAVVIEEGTSGDLYVDQVFRLPDGRLVGWEEMERYDPPPVTFEDDTVWPTLPQLMIGIPGARYGEIAVREAAALGGGVLVAIALCAAVVHRRRPG